MYSQARCFSLKIGYVITKLHKINRKKAVKLANALHHNCALVGENCTKLQQKPDTRLN